MFRNIHLSIRVLIYLGLSQYKWAEVLKRWGVLFICMASRACHIKVVPDLTTDAFLQCFWRFALRRGLCCRFSYSDQGINFKGCDTELKELLKSKQVKTFQTLTRKILDEVDGAELRLAYLKTVLTFNGGSMFQKIRMLGKLGKSLKAVFAAIIHKGR